MGGQRSWLDAVSLKRDRGEKEGMRYGVKFVGTSRGSTQIAEIAGIDNGIIDSE